MYNKVIFVICSILIGIVSGLFFPVREFIAGQKNILAIAMNIIIVISEFIFINLLYKLKQYGNLNNTFIVITITISVIIGSIIEEILKYYIRKL